MLPEHIRIARAYQRLEGSGVLSSLLNSGMFRVGNCFRYSGKKGPRGGDAYMEIKNDLHELERAAGADFGCRRNSQTIILDDKQALAEASQRVKSGFR